MGKKYGLLIIGQNDDISELNLRLIEYTEDDIGVIYEYAYDFDIEKSVRIIQEIPIRYPGLN
jgi:hypothetical protein